MNDREIQDFLAWAACTIGLLIAVYVLTAPPIILAHYHHTGDGGIPSFYNPLMSVAFSDYGAPVMWYFNGVWHADLAAIGEMPEFGWFVTTVDIFIAALFIAAIGAPFRKLVYRK